MSSSERYRELGPNSVITALNTQERQLPLYDAFLYAAHHFSVEVNLNIEYRDTHYSEITTAFTQ